MVAWQVSNAPLRLAYQSFGQTGGMETYQDQLESTVRSSVSADVEITVRRLEWTIIAGKGYSSAQAMDVPLVLKSVAAAIDDGAEAVAIGNGFDPGLWEARELFDVPILGLFETVTSHGLRIASRLGVLCTGKSGPARIEELAARYGVWPRLVDPIAVGVDVPTVVRALTDPELRKDVATAVLDAINELRARGAEAVVVASGALGIFVDSVPNFAPSLPIVSAVQVLVAELEAAGRMARRGVYTTSRVGRFAQPPQAIQELVRDDRTPA
jgi:Asp/Glu/hydantoin racemase